MAIVDESLSVHALWRTVARCLFLLFIAILLLFSIRPTSALTYNLLLGASGDNGSFGSLGVRADMRTRVYTVNAPDLDDSFWVGATLRNGSGIQFGYDIPVSGTYCMSGKIEAGASFTCKGGSETVNGSQLVWFWQYSPDISVIDDYYFGTGLLGSTILNGTWHTFTIMPDSQNAWDFLLDHHQVANASLPILQLSSAYFVAEKVTSSPAPGRLGPVEFRNLAYLKEDGWHLATALNAIVNCPGNRSCVPISYGVSVIGPNHVIAGTSIPQPKDGALLWSTGTESTVTASLPTTSFTRSTLPIAPELFYGALAAVVVAALLMIEFVILPRRRRGKKR